MGKENITKIKMLAPFWKPTVLLASQPAGNCQHEGEQAKWLLPPPFTLD